MVYWLPADSVSLSLCVTRETAKVMLQSRHTHTMIDAVLLLEGDLARHINVK